MLKINSIYMTYEGARRGRKPKEVPVFKNDEYEIVEVPLNYAINVKVMRDGNSRHERVKLLSEQLYSPLDRGLTYARETAEYMIAKYRKLYKLA